MAASPRQAAAPERSGSVFRRVLLKLSGEALMGELPYGTDPACVEAVARSMPAAAAARPR